MVSFLYKKNISKYILIITSFIFPWVTLLSNPLMRFGSWGQTDPIIIGHYLLMTLLAIAVFCLFLKNPTLIQKIFFHPWIIVFLILILWSVLTLPFLNIPLLSILGHPQTGQGILWFCSFLLLMASSLIIIHFNYGQPFIFNLVFASLAILSLNTLGSARYGAIPDWLWSPHFVVEYIAFFGISFIGLAGFFEKKWQKFACLTFGIVIIFLSHNRSAMIATFIAFPVFFIFYFFQEKYSFFSKKLAIFISFLTPILIMMFSVALTTFNVEGMFVSAAKRGEVIKAILSEFQDHPNFWFTGGGWGYISDIMASQFNNFSSWAQPFESEKMNWLSNAEFAPSLYFHSHVAVFEGLVGAGIIGALGILVIQALPVFFTSTKILPFSLFFSLAYSITSCIWFEMPGTQSFIVFPIAMFLYSAIKENNFQKDSISKKSFLTIFLFSLFLSFAWAFYYSFKVSAYNNLVTATPFSKIINKYFRIEEPSQHIAYAGQGGLYFADKLREINNLLLEKAHQKIELTKEDMDNFKTVLYTASFIQNPSLILEISLFPLYYNTLFFNAPKALKEIVTYSPLPFEKLIKNINKKAPKRAEYFIYD